MVRLPTGKVFRIFKLGSLSQQIKDLQQPLLNTASYKKGK